VELWLTRRAGRERMVGRTTDEARLVNDTGIGLMGSEALDLL
jgi:hypothetical protein